MGIEELQFEINSDWKEWYRKNGWAAFVPMYAEDSEGNKFMKPHNREIIYRQTFLDDGKHPHYACNECGSEIMAATVAHPIWDGPFPCSGSGRCHYENVPYCPKCEEESSFRGIPIEC